MSEGMFADRFDAGGQLAEKLTAYRGENAIVLALPRGGVVVGSMVAQTLSLPLDIVVVRKVGHPHSPEYAICAVDEKGTRLCDELEVSSVDQSWLSRETEKECREALRRVKRYRGSRPPLTITGTTAIIVDDGIATGLSTRLAVAAVKTSAPKRVVVAVPVASAEAAAVLSREVDEMIVLSPPSQFGNAVGLHYGSFPQVTDEEVIDLLAP